MDSINNNTDAHNFNFVPWKIAQVILGITTFLAGMLILLGFYSVIIDSDANVNITLIIIALGSGAIMLLAAWFFGPFWSALSISTLGFRIPTGSFSTNIWLMTVVLLGSLGMSIVYTVTLSLLGIEMVEVPIDKDTLSNRLLIVLLILISLWGPLAEEVFFRGFVFSGLLPRIGFTWALLLTSLIFSVVHLDPKVMVPIFISGVLFTWLYYRTNSIWSSFVVHSAHNMIAFLASLLT